MLGTLYIVATPIGNLEDMTLRAIRILAEVDHILCEDTRQTGKLLRHYAIDNKTSSYHANSKLTKIDTICQKLLEGKSIALVSDAGTPIVSDPGILLVQELYKRLPDINIVALPGASALLSALVVSGINAHEFIFLGFLPNKKGRQTLFKEIAESTRTVILYESVHRLSKTLDSLSEHLGPEREIAVLKELTKMHEQRIGGKVSEVREYFITNPDRVRGEFVVVIEPK